MKVLLVEDEPEMASAIRDVLATYDMIVDHAPTLAAAARAAELGAFDVMILDRQLPDGDGLRFLKTLREQGNVTPVLVLTALAELSERVVGLEIGADDYLAKPFAVEELMARLRALARRPAHLQTDIVTAGNLSYDFVNRTATIGSQALDLKRRELLVLETLLKRVGRMVPRGTLMQAVFSMDDDVQPNALDTHVSRLRRKLSDAESALAINVVRGVGYMLSVSA
ncbi:response regulator transcription factor [Xanthomonas floridensis]|uniref:DNA-binding response regulator n=1 Tax=Xanthomonas floridensis TaxID=1843580 RepID=A0A1A9MAL5_9XANT|nr:response regulator transcription factor [Xanthomonas floridensis]MEA5125721.1 response regulator transcription factor [Xanthomonas floridensis]MEA5133596.1 response regulator transcription factor [Xanthomonas floridensis]OAG66667.1 DNA-binding response regulator [Xanthomonas floridensis]